MTTIIKNNFTPLPSNIRFWWNFGSLIIICLILQLITGVFLSIYYENNIENTFDRIIHLEQNINKGWLIRSLHANGASFFFIFIYLHIARNLYFKSFNLSIVWLTGSLILILLFITAFIGYVLPWGQIRFWGATVITNLLSSIPYFGKTITTWIWGGFSVRKVTLIRFFSLHFIFPFLILRILIIHIFFLHIKLSNNPLGVNSKLDILPFIPFFLWKDLVRILIFFIRLLTLRTIFPCFFQDPDNFIFANPLATPSHIQPEWYFLFAYAILRTIPNKLGGVIALFISILILIIIPLLNSLKFNNHAEYQVLFKILFSVWVLNFFFLRKLGRREIEFPFIELSQIRRLIYFRFFIWFI